MLSSVKSSCTWSAFFANLHQAYQGWVRRFIIDDDPYDALTTEDLAEENTGQIHGVESAKLV